MRRYKTAADRIVYIMHREDWTPFYVGKGAQTRPGGHIKEAKNTAKNNHKLNIIRQMGRKLVKERTIIIARGLTNAEACAMEILLIAAIGRADKGLGPLVNLTDGGEGAMGCIQSRETRQKRSDSIRAVLARPDVKEKQRAGVIAALAEPEVRARISTATKIALARPETNKKLRAGIRDALAKPEVREQRRARSIAIFNDPEVKARLRAGIIKGQSNPDVRARMSASKLAYYSDPANAKKRKCSGILPYVQHTLIPK